MSKNERCPLPTNYEVRVPIKTGGNTNFEFVEAPCCLMKGHSFRCIPVSSLDVRRKYINSMRDAEAPRQGRR